MKYSVWRNYMGNGHLIHSEVGGQDYKGYRERGGSKFETTDINIASHYVEYVRQKYTSLDGCKIDVEIRER